MRMIAIAAGLAALLTGAAPAAAAPAKKGGADSERKICKSKGVVGSRLKRIRECATAQEWEEMELQERLGLMRKQYNGDPGCNGGGSACYPARDTPW